MEINELNKFLEEKISPHEKLRRLLDVNETKIFLRETGSQLLSILRSLGHVNFYNRGTTPEEYLNEKIEEINDRIKHSELYGFGERETYYLGKVISLMEEVRDSKVGLGRGPRWCKYETVFS